VEDVYTDLVVNETYYADGDGNLVAVGTDRYVGLAVATNRLLIRTDWEWR
jgi:hypothetical protein